MPQKSIDKTWIYHLNLFDSAIKAFEKHKFQQSIIKIRQAIWTEINNADAYYFLYLCQAAQNTKQVANQKMLERAKLMNPLCQIYDLDPQESIKVLKRIIESSIKFETSILEQKGNLIINNWYNYSVMLHEQTDYQRVEDMYQRLFRKYPQLYTTKSHAFLGNYANMLYDIGKYDEAVKLYEIQIKLDPNELRYFSNCAMLYTILGNYNKAQQYIKTALDGLPNRTSFIFNYANVLAKTGRYDLSIQYIKKAILKEPIDPIFRLKLSLTVMLSDIKQCQLDICKQNLKKSANAFTQSIKKKKLDMVNCNKRILSMSNIQCLNIYTSKIIEVVEAEFFTWKYFKFILETVSDYLIVGQATKLELNIKILKIVEESFNDIDQEVSQDSIKTSTLRRQQVEKLENKESEVNKNSKKEKLKQIFGDWLQKLRNQRNKKKAQQNVNI